MASIFYPANGSKCLAVPAPGDSSDTKGRHATYQASVLNRVCITDMRLVIQCDGFLGGWPGEGSLMVRFAGETLLRKSIGTYPYMVDSNLCVTGGAYLASRSASLPEGCIIDVDVLKAFRDGAVTSSAVIEVSSGGAYGGFIEPWVRTRWGWSYNAQGLNLNYTNANQALGSQDYSCSQATKFSITVYDNGTFT